MPGLETAVLVMNASTKRLNHGISWSTWMLPILIITVIFLPPPSEQTGGCSPCPTPCHCTMKSDHTCRVNCSSRALTTFPSVEKLPPARNTSELLFAGNLLTTIPPGTLDLFIKLQILNLASNPWQCDCGLSWLRSWIDGNSDVLYATTDTTCNLPVQNRNRSIANVSEKEFTCETTDLASCVNNSSSLQLVPVIFNYSTTGTTIKDCNDHCFRRGYRYGILHSSECGCGVVAENVSACDCSQTLLSKGNGYPHCGRKFAVDAFFVSAQVTIDAPSVISSESSTTFTVKSALENPVDYAWSIDGIDFITPGPVLTHTFLHTGLHNFSVELKAGANSEKVSLVIPVVSPISVKLSCPYYANIDRAITAKITSFTATSLHATWKRTFQTITRRSPATCRNGTNLYANACFFVNESLTTWEQAEHACRSEGGHLLKLGSSDGDMDDIHAFLNVTFLSALRHSEFWIGLNDRGYEGIYQWSDGEILGETKGWGTNQPDAKYPGDDCVVLAKTRHGDLEWADVDCTSPRPSICKVEFGAVVNPSNTEMTGAGHFGWEEELTELNVTARKKARDKITTIVFPGYWFHNYGKLFAWDFRTANITVPTQLRLQVFAIDCAEGAHVPITPGCIGAPSPYSACVLNTTVQNCPPLPKCRKKEQPCYLDGKCKTITAPCNCMSVPAVPSCQSTPLRTNGSTPLYILQGETIVDLHAGPSKLARVLASSTYVNKHYVLGISYNSSSMPIDCTESNTSKEGQSYISSTQPLWINMRGHSKNLTVHPVWKGNRVCSIRAIYNLVNTGGVPSELTSHSSLPGNGTYIFNGTIRNALGSKELSCSTQVMEPVEALKMISPFPINEIMPSSRRVLELGQSYKFLIKIERGSNVTFTFSDQANQVSTLPYSPHCPSEFSTSICNGKKDTLFASITRSYEDLRKLPTKLVFNVRNRISSLSLVMKISVCQRVSGIRIAPPDMDEIPVNLAVSFKASAVNGSCLNYSWNMTGEILPDSPRNQLVYTFKRAGKFVLKLKVWNGINSQETNITLITVIVAEPKNAALVALPQRCLVQVKHSFKVQFEANLNSSATFIWDFADGTVETGSVTVTNSPFSLSARHRYSSPGSYTVRVNITDGWFSSTASREITVWDPTFDVQFNATSMTVATGGNVRLVGMVTGETKEYNMTFFWQLGDGSGTIKTTLPAIGHTFNSSGFYHVNLTASVGVKNESATILINTEDPVSGLELKVPHPIFQQTSIAINASISTGTNVRYQFISGNLKLSDSFSSSILYTCQDAGLYNISVTAYNSISHSTVYRLVLVNSAGNLSITNLSAPAYIKIQENFSVSVEVIHRGPSKLKYFWNFGDGNTKNGTGVVHHLYSTAGEYALSVMVQRGTDRVSKSVKVVVEYTIQSVDLTPESTVLSVREGMTTSVLVGITVLPLMSSSLKFTWTLNSVTFTEPPTSKKNFTFDHPDEYNITLSVQNNVSSIQKSVAVAVLGVVTGLKIGKVLPGKFVRTGKPVTFQGGHTYGTRVSYTWDFGDASQEQCKLVNCTHIFNRSGVHSVILNASNSLSSQQATFQSVVQDAVSGLKFSPRVADANQPTSFTATISSGTNVSFLWKPCLNCRQSATSDRTFSHRFSGIGHFNMTVVAYNEVSSESVSSMIDVLEGVTKLEILIRPNASSRFVKINRPTELAALYEHGSNLNFEWLVVTANLTTTKLNGNHVMYRFHVLGAHIITLKSSNTLGEAEVSLTVEVQEEINGLAIRLQNNYAEVDTGVDFAVDIESGSDTFFRWDFGDNTGISITEINYTHVFSIAGTHLVKLTAENNVSKASDSVIINIEEVIQNVTLRGCCKNVLPSGETVGMEAFVSYGNFIKYAWTITHSTAGTKTISGKRLSVIFPSSGVYNITVDAVNHISSASVSGTVIVQTKIDKVGLVLPLKDDKLYKHEIVEISADINRGSDVRYKWIIDDNERSSTELRLKIAFDEAGPHTVKVIVYNDLGYVDDKIIIEVFELLCPLTLLTPVTPKRMTVEKSNGLNLEVDVETFGCLHYSVLYKWTAYSSESCVGPKTQTNLTFARTPALELPSNTLEVGTYCFILEVNYDTVSINLKEYFIVDITPSTLVAIIHGGSERTHGEDDQLEITSASYDPDAPVAKGGHLTYNWSCIKVASSDEGNLCSDLPTKGKTLNIKANFLAAGFKYRFKLEVSDGRRRHATTSQVIEVVPGSRLAVSVSCQSCIRIGRFSIQAHLPTTMQGSCNNCYPYDIITYHWSIADQSGSRFNLSTAKISTGFNKQYLNIKGGVLRDTTGYKFILEVLRRDSISGTASLSIPSSSFDPRNISCSLDPVEAVVLERPIIITCQNDGELVRYRLSMQWQGEEGVDVEDMVLYRGFNPNMTLYLPHFGPRVRVQVAVEDESGAMAVVLKREVTISLLELKSRRSHLRYIREKIDTVYKALMLKGEVPLMLQYSLVVATEVKRTYLEEPSDASSDTFNDTTYIKTTLLQNLDDIRVTSLEAAGVMATILDNLAGSPEGFESHNAHALRIFDGICIVLNKMPDYGTNIRATRPDTIMNLANQLISIFDKTRLQKGLKFLGDKTQDLSSNLARTLTPDEPPISYSKSTFRLMIQKVRGQRLPDRCLGFQLNNIKRTSSQNDEVTLSCVMFHTNPYQKTKLQPSTPVSAINMRNHQKLSRKKRELHYIEDGLIKMYLFASNFTHVDIVNDSIYDTQDYGKLTSAGLHHTRTTVQGNSSKIVEVLVEKAQSEDIALSIQLRFSPIDDLMHNNVKDFNLKVYFGFGFTPSEVNFTEFKIISLGDMVLGERHTEYTFFVNKTTFFSTATTELLLINENEETINVEAAAYFSSCLFLDETNEAWLDVGCNPTDESLAAATVCTCNHMTAFSSLILVPPNAIAFRNLGSLDLATNPVAISLCSAVLFVYIILTIWARRKDLADEKKAGVVPLCGKDGPYRYEVSVFTGMAPGSGTTANVGLKLYGENGKGDAKHLCRSNAFKRNGQDVVIVASDTSLGNIWQVRVWHDNTGKHPSWYLSYLRVRDLQTQSRWYFLADSWLSLSAPDGVIEKKLKAADLQSLSKFSLRLRNEAASGFSEKHIWSSVFEHRSHSRFTRVQRLTSCVTLFYTFMFVNAMWYGLLKTREDLRLDFWQDTFSWEELIVGVISSIIVFPVNFVIMQLFRKSRVKIDPLTKIPKNETIEMDDMCNRHHQGNIVYDNNGNSCGLKRTEALMKIHREISSTDSSNTRDCSELGTWSSTSRSTSSLERDELTKKTNRDNKKLWSYDTILRWSEDFPSWKTEDSANLSLRADKKSLYMKDSGIRESLMRERSDKGSIQRRSSTAWTRRMSIDTLLKTCEEDIDEEENSKTSEKMANMNQYKSKMPTYGGENGRRFSLTRRNRRVSTTTTADTILSIEEDDFISSQPTELSELSDFSEYFGSRRTTLASEYSERYPTYNFRRNASEEDLGREDTFDLDSASMARSASVIASFGSRSHTSTSSLRSKMTRGTSQSFLRIQQESRSKKVCLLPHWCIYIAYFLCAAVSIISIIMVILYGHKFGRTMALKWLIALCISIIQSAFITEPLKVLFIAIFLALVTKSLDDRVEDNVEVSPILESNEKIKEQKMKPIKGYALLQAQEEGRKVYRMHVMVRQVIAYMFILWVVVAVNYANHDKNAYYLRNGIYNAVAKSVFGALPGTSLVDMQRSSDVIGWLEKVVVPYTHPVNTSASYIHLLGVLHLRQVRSVDENCTEDYHEILRARFRSDSCYGNREFDVDKENYDANWKKATEGEWQYETAEETGDWPLRGTYANYDGGGYVQNLKGTAVETMTLLAGLKTTKWIDERTRALFVDFTTYNANTDLYTVTRVCIEIAIYGAITSSTQVTSTHFLTNRPGVLNSYIIFMALLLPVLLYLTTHIILTVKDEGHSFVANIWNWIDLLIAILATASISSYIYVVWLTTSTLHKQLKDNSAFVSFTGVVCFHTAFKVINAVLLFLLMCKVTQQLRFIKVLSVFGRTVYAGLSSLLGISIGFTMLWFFYAMMGYLMYGSKLFAFRSFRSSLSSLILVLTGKFDFHSPYNSYPWFSGLFFSTYVASVFCVLCLVFAVFRKTYHLTKSMVKYPPTLNTQDHEMIEFIIQRFKIWAGFEKPKQVSRSFRKVKFKGMPSLSTRSTYSSNVSRSASDGPASTTTLEEIEGITQGSQYTHQLIQRMEPSWDEVLAKLDQIVEFDREEARICADIARALIKTAYAEKPVVKPHPTPTARRPSLRLGANVSSFIYSNRSKLPQIKPLRPLTSKLTKNMKAKSEGSPSSRKPENLRRGRPLIHRGSLGAVSAISESSSASKQSSSTRSSFSTNSNRSGSSTKSERSNVSVLSIRSASSSDSVQINRSVQFSLDTKPPVPPQRGPVVRRSLPSSFSATAKSASKIPRRNVTGAKKIAWSSQPDKIPRAVESSSSTVRTSYNSDNRRRICEVEKS